MLFILIIMKNMIFLEKVKEKLRLLENIVNTIAAVKIT